MSVAAYFPAERVMIGVVRGGGGHVLIFNLILYYLMALLRNIISIINVDKGIFALLFFIMFQTFVESLFKLQSPAWPDFP